MIASSSLLLLRLFICILRLALHCTLVINMQSTLAFLALAAAVVASPAPQAVTSSIAPAATAPAGCEASYSGDFQITVVNITAAAAKRDVAKVRLTAIPVV